jgi:hypothetical protein
LFRQRRMDMHVHVECDRHAPILFD